MLTMPAFKPDPLMARDPWAAAVGRQPAAAAAVPMPQLAFATPTKVALNMVELALGRTFMGLEAAAADLIKARTDDSAKPAANKAAKMMRALNCVFNLERHFTDRGTEAWMSKLSTLIEETLAAPAHVPTVLNPDTPPFVPADANNGKLLDIDARLMKLESRMHKSIATVSADVQHAVNAVDDQLPVRIQCHLDNMDLPSIIDAKINDKIGKLEPDKLKQAEPTSGALKDEIHATIDTRFEDLFLRSFPSVFNIAIKATEDKLSEHGERLDLIEQTWGHQADDLLPGISVGVLNDDPLTPEELAAVAYDADDGLDDWS